MGHILLESPPLLDVREQVAARAQLNHEANVFLCLKGVVQLHYVLVVALLQYAHFQFSPPLQVFLTLQVLLAHGLDRHELLAQLVQSKRHLAEGTFPKNTADPIELTCGGWRSLELLEVEADHLAQFDQVPIVDRLLPVCLIAHLGHVLTLPYHSTPSQYVLRGQGLAVVRRYARGPN